ncbi:MAG: LuxR C-terminal-related transcriptional regulator, partial [Rhizobiaceae bacterium]
KIVDDKAPDVIFVDLSMPGDVFGTIHKIAESAKATKVIVFTAFSSVDSAMRALDAGAMGFLLKGATLDELFDAVETVKRNELFITKHYAMEIMNGMRNRAEREATNRALRLNVREEQILGFVRQARTNKEIANSLAISEKTVKRYMSGLMEKLHVRNRVDVAMFASKQVGVD